MEERSSLEYFPEGSAKETISELGKMAAIPVATTILAGAYFPHFPEILLAGTLIECAYLIGRDSQRGHIPESKNIQNVYLSP